MTLKPPRNRRAQPPDKCWRCQPATMTVRQTVHELLNSFSHSAIRRSFGWRHLTSITLPNAPQTAHHHALRVSCQNGDGLSASPCRHVRTRCHRWHRHLIIVEIWTLSF